MPLEELPHCGSVVPGEDEERVARLFAFLRRTFERRKRLFAERGVFSLGEYRRLGAEPLPRIVVLLDGYAGFAAAFERVNLGELVDALPRLVGEGRPLGVHFVVTADRRGAVPNALGGVVPAKIVLRMADEDEFAALGIAPKLVRGAWLPPGRGFLPASGLELQVAILGGDAPGEAQARALAGLAAELCERHPGASAPPVRSLPSTIDRSQLPPARALAVSIGLGDTELEPLAVDLAERHFLVVGPYRSGRSSALAALCAGLAEAGGCELHLLAPRRTLLSELGLFASVAAGIEACDARAAELASGLDARPPGAPALVVVVDDGEELAETPGAVALETLVRRGRDRDVRVIAAAERQGAQRAFGGWLRELRKEEHGLLLSPDPDVDGELLAVRLPRRTTPVYPPGRGYLVAAGTVELVQVAT